VVKKIQSNIENARVSEPFSH